MTALSPRQHRLWERISGRPWVSTRDAQAINRLLGAPKRTTARADLDLFCRLGLLVEYGPTNARWYEPVGGAS